MTINIPNYKSAALISIAFAVLTNIIIGYSNGLIFRLIITMSVQQLVYWGIVTLQKKGKQNV